MDAEDKRNLAAVGAGAAGGGAIGAAGPLTRRWESRGAARANADEIVDHLRKSGITPEHRIAIVGVGASGKSELSRALSKKGFHHIPLDGWGDKKIAARSKKGWSPGSVIDQSFALRRTGGGHYDAVIKTHTPDSEEIRRRLVQRGSGAQHLYNKIDYGEFDKEIQSDFDKLKGERTSLTGGTVAITGPHKAENAASVPMTGAEKAWKDLYGTAKIKNPIKTSEILRHKPEFRGAAGALIGGGVVAGALGIRSALDNSRRNKAMSSKIDRLITLDSAMDGIVKFQYYNDDHTVRNVAVGTGLVGAGVGGTLLQQQVQRTGGWKANIRAARLGPDELGKATGNIAKNVGDVGTSVGKNLRSFGKKPLQYTGVAAKSAWRGIGKGIGSILSKFGMEEKIDMGKYTELSSRLDKLIEFGLISEIGEHGLQGSLAKNPRFRSTQFPGKGSSAKKTTLQEAMGWAKNNRAATAGVYNTPGRRGIGENWGWGDYK